ncbi:unnamed protein product [Nezara viridula]|uniref:Mitochondrial ribonuclease P catalytic subunit n=1 Tax=Nezara viridula TaxID=85310 RepID=A0A9P0MRZ9_NEZVI|nr:unnamed protein product [Nezara viridula]
MALKQGRWIFMLKHLHYKRLIVDSHFPLCNTTVDCNKISDPLIPIRSFSFKNKSKEIDRVNSSEKNDQTGQFLILTNAIKKYKNNFSLGDIETLKKTAVAQEKQITEINFDAIFIMLCGYEKAFLLGKSYFDYLRANGSMNIGVIGKFFRLCYDCKEQCSDIEKSLMLNLFKKLVSKYDILDHKTCENVALGLSICNEWKECLKLLEMARFTSVPSTKMYSAIIEAAFCNHEMDLGFNLMHEMVRNKLTPLPNVYTSWLSASKFSRNAFNELFKFFEKHDLHPSEEVTMLLLPHYNQHNKRTKYCKIAEVNKSGMCQSCFHQLNPLTIDESEFKKMRDAFLNPVLIGKDIFHKSKPEEFKSFINFLERIEHTDVVLDGLNIALSPTNRKHDLQLSAGVLCRVVKHFVNLSKKVMVLGRKHMSLWPKVDMDYIKKNAFLFLVENVSTDDPYLLYATMHFGLGTAFVSRDQMRSHKFLLRDPELKDIFAKWQQKHQYYFLYASENGKVSLMEPMKYSQSVQQTKEGTWHIPISTDMSGIPGHLIPYKKKWLCFPNF